MKIRFLFIIFLTISIVMHSTYGFFISFCETTSIYWYFANDRKWNPKTKILVLGDSQIVSGILPETVAKIENVELDEVLYLPRPSQQPEGILSDTYESIQKLPNLKKIYVNLSPLNTSKNSITDAHKQLFFSFGNFKLYHLTDPLLRKAYFGNIADVSWKFVIQIFPYFGLSSNLNRIFYDPIVQSDLKRRRLESESIQKSMASESGAWIWKSIGDSPSLQELDEFQNLNTSILSGKRNLSIQLWNQCFQIWKEHRLDVVVLRIPFSPKMELDMRDKKANLVSDGYLEKIQSENVQNRIFVYDFKHEFLKEYSYFADLTHLNQKGRDAFAKLLKVNLLNHTNSSAKSM
ncbi:hypothetical protein EHQ91_08910 [Leptospira biflexa]|uniref:hypothetical protein n=1 Tax=Leptospira biflexa TaxID=172 RepID=UPI0010910C36|nr:hypothetical protein [Leptospira biflexa]TGM55056.1 hypothetical protein EHQ91_08910 [Leptospira biflexa]